MVADVMIVGAGPAGLSAALVLGRCCRHVLVFDDGHPRNAASSAVHGFLTRDGTPPAELLRLGREQLEPYHVDIHAARVRNIARTDQNHFRAELDHGGDAVARKVLLATGVRDCLPDLAGLASCWGKSVFQCPYCDAWEFRDQTIAAYGSGKVAADFVLALTAWSRDLLLFTDGGPLATDVAAELSRQGVRVVADPIQCVENRDGQLEQVVLVSGKRVAVRALFLPARQAQRTHLAAQLGCEIQPRGTVAVGKHERTRVPGVYVAGDVAGDVQFAIVAAAEGAQAAYAIHRELRIEDTA